MPFKYGIIHCKEISMADFGKLYDYSTKNGVVIPQTSSVRATIEDAFKDIFGSDFSTEPYTANGMIIGMLTNLFVDVCGVNAQNMNSMNIEQAVGSFLDSLGAMWGIARLEGESDGEYRKRILASASRGSGFASSIANAIGNVSGVTKVVVLDNGNEDPAVLPVDATGTPYPHSIAVDPHSVFISVLGGTASDIISAIAKTKSAGCGFTHNPGYGVSTNGYYVPTQRYLKISVDISAMAYTGADIVADTKAAIKSLIEDNSINATITKPMVTAAIASYGKNIICTGVKFTVSDTAQDLSSAYEDVEEVVVFPYKYISVPDNLISVSVA